jgi:hypothetical protein
MDDSERSYGYSEDIYHGRSGPGGQYRQDRPDEGGPWYPDRGHWERSYEYGAEESLGRPHPADLGPEEAAMHIRRGYSPARDHGSRSRVPQSS